MLSEQKLKNKIQDYSKKFDVLPQQLYGLYGLEQLLKKVEKSDFRDSFVLKGGYLLSSTFGLSSRTTRDLDATIRNMKLTEQKVKEFIDIITTPDEKGVQQFKLRKQSIIREKFDYDGYNLKFNFLVGKTNIPIELDLTTGEDLLPINSNSKIPLIFEEGYIGIPSYPLEQILADKFYTTIAYASIDDKNSRTKDLYDIYFLTKFNENINYLKVNQSVEKTMKQREMDIPPSTYENLLKSLEKSDFQKSQWLKFQEYHSYARNINFEEILNSATVLSSKLVNISSTKNLAFSVEEQIDEKKFILSEKFLIEKEKIDPEIVFGLHKKGLLQQDKYNNLLMMWTEDNKIVGATEVGIIEGSTWNKVQKNSDKQVGFNVRNGEPKQLVVVNKNIDVLKYMSENKSSLKNTWILSTEGTEGKALDKYLSRFKNEDQKIKNWLPSTMDDCIQRTKSNPLEL